VYKTIANILPVRVKKTFSGVIQKNNLVPRPVDKFMKLLGQHKKVPIQQNKKGPSDDYETRLIHRI